MNWLYEDPVSILIGGLLLTIALGGSWIQTGRRGLLIGAVAALLLSAALLTIERLTVTESEAVRALVQQIALDVRHSEPLDKLLAHIHPMAGDVRRRAEGELPKYKLTEVTVKSGMKVDVRMDHQPPRAVAEFNVVVVGGDSQGLMTDMRAPRFVIVTFYKDGEHWKVWNYEHHEPTHGMTLGENRE